MYNFFELPEKKFKIFMAAANVFAKKGYHKTTIEDIAQEADIGKSTVYEYVESKEKLFSEIVNRGFGFFMDKLAEMLYDAQDIEETIKTFIKSWLLLIKNHYSLYCVILCQYYDPRNDQKTSELYWELTNHMEEILSPALKRAVQAGKLRDMDISLLLISLVGMLMGASSLFDRSNKEQIDVEKLGDEMGELFLKGIMLRL